MAIIKIKPNQIFGQWTTKEQQYITEPSGRKKLKWLCICSCGEMGLVARGDLLRKKSTRCRKCNETYPVDLSGKTFSQWYVISCDIKKLNRRYCTCRCSCGHIHEVAAQTLRNHTSTKCTSCYYKQIDGSNYTGHPLYSIWISMLARCYNKNNLGYYNYGGRGITVCKRWFNFNNFIKDMFPRTSKKHSIDRIDNNKGYSPSNCRWATSIQQGRNRRNNILITYNNITKNMSEWAEYLNVKQDNLYHYLTRNTFEKAYKFYLDKKNAYN